MEVIYMVPAEGIADITTTVTTAATGLGPAVLGVGAGAIGVSVLLFGLRKAWSFFRGLVKG
jgi:hypothetical protein